MKQREAELTQIIHEGETSGTIKVEDLKIIKTHNETVISNWTKESRVKVSSIEKAITLRSFIEKEQDLLKVWEHEQFKVEINVILVHTIYRP